MKTINVLAEIDASGKLSIEVSCGLPPGPAEVLVVVQPKPVMSSPYDTFAGALAGCLPPDADIETNLREIKQQSWQSMEPEK